MRRAERLSGEFPRLIETGASVTIIGQGEPARANWYKNKFQIPCPVLCDPDEQAYSAYGLLEMSPWLLMGRSDPDVDYLRKLTNKHREMGRPVADNPFLLPGEFVVATGGRVVLAYRYQYCDNYPDVDVLIESIHEALAAAV